MAARLAFRAPRVIYWPALRSHPKVWSRWSVRRLHEVAEFLVARASPSAGARDGSGLVRPIGELGLLLCICKVSHEIFRLV